MTTRRISALRFKPEARSAIEFIGNLHRLELKPGDKFVLTVPGEISREEEQRISEIFERELPGHKVLVFAGGVQIGIIGTEK